MWPHPPQDVFASGQLGILRPKYYRRYLVVAFRYLTGVPLTKEEAAAFAFQRSTVPATASPLSPVEQWIQARNQVAGVTAINAIDQFRPLQGPNRSFESYQNCLDDAFTRAAQTLSERTARWGTTVPCSRSGCEGRIAYSRTATREKRSRHRCPLMRTLSCGQTGNTRSPLPGSMRSNTKARRKTLPRLHTMWIHPGGTWVT